MTPFEEILNQLSHYHYTKLTLFLVESITVFYGALNYKKIKPLNLLFWYLLIDYSLFITSLVIDSYKLFSLEKIHTLNQTINAGISLLEIGFYFSYFRTQLDVRKIIKINTYMIIIFSTYPLIHALTSDSITLLSFFSGTHLFSTISFFLIFPLSIKNMIELVKDSNIENLYKEPSFWVTTGILYYSIISTPYYFFRGFFSINSSLKITLDSVLFYTPFTINIICILIAFICKKQVKN
jgi:hypothetical protein